jgi:cell division protein FtsB
MVSPQFVIDTMRDLNMRFFAIQDANYNLQYQQFQPIPIEDSIKKMERFIRDAGTGMYRISIFQTNDRKANGEPKSSGFHYEVMITESLKQPADFSASQHGQSNPGSNQTETAIAGMLSQGTGMMGGVGLDRYLNEKDTIMALRLEIQQLKMEKKFLEDNINNREQRIRDEYERKLSMNAKIESIAGVILPEVMKRFPAGGSPGINGIGQTMEKENDNNDKTRVIAAINKLVAIDKDFADNIEKLAQLAEKSPETYNQAVSMLKMMAG